MENLVAWLLFGLLVGIIGSTFDLPLRMDKLFFALVIGSIGSVIGGMLAYFIYGLEVEGINISSLSFVFFGAIASILLLKISGKTMKGRGNNYITEGGENTNAG